MIDDTKIIISSTEEPSYIPIMHARFHLLLLEVAVPLAKALFRQYLQTFAPLKTQHHSDSYYLLMLVHRILWN